MAISKEISSGTLATLAGANNNFAIHLYQTVQDGRMGRNLFFSPLSISTALAMTYLGARGDTASQISTVFRFNQIGEKVHTSFKDLNDSLYQPSTNFTLKSGNKLYGKSGYKFVTSFIEGTASYYDSAIEAIDDFASPAARKIINDWVSKQTEGKITNLISPGVLDSFTRLVLVNAIYFKGNWAAKFDVANTTKEVFKVMDERKKVPVNLMIQSGKFPLATDKVNDCLVLEMPYQGQNLSILIALPMKDDGLGKLESKLSAEVMRNWDAGLQTRRVNIMLPKFKLEEQLELGDALKVMGMPDAFDVSKANFEGITGDRHLYISAVIHKAFIDVNEEGSEAAAATAVVMKLRCARPREPEKPVLFRADHPFLFMIRHRRSKSVLFMGRVMDPGPSSSP